MIALVGCIGDGCSREHHSSIYKRFGYNGRTADKILDFRLEAGKGLRPKEGMSLLDIGQGGVPRFGLGLHQLDIMVGFDLIMAMSDVREYTLVDTNTSSAQLEVGGKKRNGRSEIGERVFPIVIFDFGSK